MSWLQSLVPRLTLLNDPEGAASALAELRVYGAFLEASFKVTPIKTSDDATPDFSVDAGDGPIIVEVFAKHQDGAQTALQSRIAAGATPPGVHRSTTHSEKLTIKTTISSVQPGGAPDPSKPHDSVQANVISRVCSAKKNESQLSADVPSLLWIDFCHFGAWPDVLGPEQASPLISGHHGLTSGALWYAFYGWKGAPIFQEDFFLHERIVPMGHDGRFRLVDKKKSKLSAVILAMSKGLVLLENPWAANPLPHRTRRLCERLPWFDLERSICDWSPGDALAHVDLGRRQIEVMHEWWKQFDDF
jgi:hypothetical protein